eukprot:1163710-Ditylum_brightwellii.AAC.1
MSKRPLDVPQVPNPLPSSRVESGTDTGVEAGAGLLEKGDSSNGSLAIPPKEVGASASVCDADPSSVISSSKAAESIVKP